MRFIIPGPPISKARPRAARRGNYVTIYNSQKEEDQLCILEMKNQLSDYANSPDRLTRYEPRDLPLYDVYYIDMKFYIKIPGSWKVAQKKAAINETILAYSKPDCDNLIKFVQDCGNGVLWSDDCRIATLSAAKYYSPSPRTEIEVTGSFLTKT